MTCSSVVALETVNRRAEPVAELNLIIFHQPGRQQISDFVTIRELMRERAPEIDVFIVGPTTLLPLDFWQRRAELPTALFAASSMKVDPGVRGARLITYLPDQV